MRIHEVIRTFWYWYCVACEFKCRSDEDSEAIGHAVQNQFVVRS